MRDFLSRHSYIIIWILSLVIIGSLAILIVKLNETVPGNSSGSAEIKAPRARPQAPTPPPVPTVSVTIEKSPSGNSFVVQWENLPNGTVALKIFRGKTGTDPSTWSLWKTIDLTSDELANGSASFDLGSDAENGYAFYEEAVSDNGDNTPTGATPPLWISSSTIPTVTTSTLPTSQPNNPTNPNEPETPPSNTSSTNNEPSGNNNSSTSSSSPSGYTPTGIPYYNPEVQVTAYGTAPGDFSVSRVNQSIQLAWQNLPVNVDSITIARATDSNGPWNTIVIQHNPGTSGSYSLSIIDNSVNDPYYYELTAFQGTSTIAVYGPAYLAGN